MSIASEITRLQNDSSAIASAIEAKGVTVPAGSGYDDYASLIGNIFAGGNRVCYSGDFTTGSTAGSTQNVDIPYTGTGYPIAAIIFPKGGTSTNTTWYNTKARYAVGIWTMTKSVQATAPTYATSGDANKGHTVVVVKNSDTTAASFTAVRDGAANTFSSSNGAESANVCVRFKSAKRMNVYIRRTGYGLMASLDYTYIVVYSS